LPRVAAPPRSYDGDPVAKEHGWVALLRAINLGAHNKVPMAGLRDVFAEAGASNVRTYIQSGNVVFTAPTSSRTALARKLERAVDDAFGVSAAVVLRTFGELQGVVDSHPFGRDTATTMVAFLAKKPAAAKVRAVRALDVAPDEVELVGTDVYLRYPNGVQGATLTGARLEKELGVAATARNWRTVTRLAEMTRES
jgi:uncharacterized protein (DUF1697 family)